MTRVAASQALELAATPAVHVARLQLAEFRCYARLRLDTPPGPIVLTGPNGAGKTALLEAISLLAPGRGLRRAAPGELARRGSDGAWAVAATLTTPAGPLALGTGREGDEGERRAVRVDGRPARGQKAFADAVAIAWATPEQDRLFLDGKSARRRFLDRLVHGFAPGHAGELAAYEHSMRERARLLAEGRDDDSWLAALEDAMARHGVAIAAARAETVRRLDAAAAGASGPFPVARVALDGAIDAMLAAMPALAAEDASRLALARGRGRDAETGRAEHGPHRSDLDVRFADKGGLKAAEGSTGEQKAMVLALVLANARALAAERGAPPVLLLDEVAAHLDATRRAALAEAIAALGAQAWLTGTDEESFTALRGRARFLRVLDAAVAPRA